MVGVDVDLTRADADEVVVSIDDAQGGGVDVAVDCADDCHGLSFERMIDERPERGTRLWEPPSGDFNVWASHRVLERRDAHSCKHDFRRMEKISQPFR